MTTHHKLDPQNSHYKEGRRIALDLELDHLLTEAKKSADERKRPNSGEETTQISKKHRGKPRGRLGGRRKHTGTAFPSPADGCVSRIVEVSGTAQSTHLNPQKEFEKNLEKLSGILASRPSAEPQRSSASSWSFRQQKASQCWKESRPYHLQCLLDKEAVGHPWCFFCHEPAVIRCRECLPDEWFCGDCDVLHHKKQPLHNRESIVQGFFKAIPPTTYIQRGEDGYCINDQVCILPTVRVSNCSCEGRNITVSPGKAVTLITINGRYDFHQPQFNCQTCQQQWSPGFKDLVRSGYWPASVNSTTLYTLDVLSSFQELKVISPGFSRQAFAKLLDYRTKCGGRF